MPRLSLQERIVICKRELQRRCVRRTDAVRWAKHNALLANRDPAVYNKATVRPELSTEIQDLRDMITSMENRLHDLTPEEVVGLAVVDYVPTPEQLVSFSELFDDQVPQCGPNPAHEGTIKRTGKRWIYDINALPDGSFKNRILRKRACSTRWAQQRRVAVQAAKAARSAAGQAP